MVGAGVGGAAAAFHARGEAGAARWVEIAGGVIGGGWGGVLPDLLEPAHTPRHRGPAHSILVMLGLAGVTLEVARRHCRRQADMLSRRSNDPTLGVASRTLLALAALFWRFMAGVLGGCHAGYLSHLVLDGHTPMGLPLGFR